MVNTYINLPVADLVRSRAFFEGLGLIFNDEFVDETALAMVIGETSFAMLVTHEKFQTFTPRRIADANVTSEVLIALQLESREAVDRMIADALAGGGTELGEARDHGFMYERSFADPDGHIWNPFWYGSTASGESQ